jgi:thiosulfate/3-mercaptopyruvate sulfurtransferase
MNALFAALRPLALLAAAAVIVFGPAVPVRAETVTPLVSATWVKEHLKDPNVFVLDIRPAADGADVYQKGHIPGAIHGDYDKAGWRVERGGVPFLLPTLPELEKLIGELGIDEDAHVVVVPAGQNYSDFGAGARVYWTLKVAGLAKVSILDGGHAGWIAEQNPVEGGRSKPSPKIFTATLNTSLMAEAADVQKIEQSGGATLIDSRPATFFAGKQKAPASKAYGHIPGAVNVDSATFYDGKTNRLKPQAELASIAARLPGGPAVAYCNTGHWAATDWFVLSELLGRTDVRLYYGSMVDWTSDAGRPLASSRTKWDDLKKALGLGT